MRTLNALIVTIFTSLALHAWAEAAQPVEPPATSTDKADQKGKDADKDAKKDADDKKGKDHKKHVHKHKE